MKRLLLTTALALVGGRIKELKFNFGGRKSYTVEFKIAIFLHLSVEHWHMRDNRFLNIDLPNSHCRQAVLRQRGCIN